MKPKIDQFNAEYYQIEALEATDPDNALERYKALRSRVNNEIEEYRKMNGNNNA